MAPRLDARLPYLALETSGPLGSVAVAVDGRVRGEAQLERPGNHAAELIPRVAEVLAAAGLARADLAGVVVGRGPGSFTGVRIAGATGKGLAHALGVPLWALSSLEAAAFAEPADAALRYVLFDARADRVYAACYRVEAGGLDTLVAPHATRLADLLEEGAPPGAVFMGSGATKHAGALCAHGHDVAKPPAGVPSAGALLRLLLTTPEREPVDPRAPWDPEYVQGSSATVAGTRGA